jgi:hypothetical protein
MADGKCVTHLCNIRVLETNSQDPVEVLMH